MLKRADLDYVIFFLILIVFGFSLQFVDLDPNPFTTFVFFGYFISGVTFGIIFRNKFLGGLAVTFPLTLLSWLIAVALFSSSRGITALVQAFSENFQHVLVAGLLFSSITSVAVLITYGVRRTSDIIEGNRKQRDH